MPRKSQFPPPPFWIAHGSRIGDWALNPLTPRAPQWQVKLSGVKQSKILSLAGLGRFGHQRVNSDWSLQYNIDKLKDLQVVCWRKRLIEIKTFFQQQMLNKRRQTCMPQILTLLVQ